MLKLSSIFSPAVVGISVYVLVSKLFPEEVLDINSEKDLIDEDIIRSPLIKKMVKKIMHDRALKIALISAFAIAGFNQYFTQEIEALLVDNTFKELCVKEVDGRLKVVCDIIEEHDLNSHSRSVQKLIITQDLSRDEKINLLKIKLDFIINGEYSGKKRFMIVSIIAALITVCVSGVGGLTIFLNALYRLFQEGKISRAVFEQIFNQALLKSAVKRWVKVPVEHLP
jgi:hypothetical protein